MKPDISDDEDDYEKDIKSPKKKILVKKSNKSSKTGSVSYSKAKEGHQSKVMEREAPRKWTPVEDEIFLEIMSKLVKARMWDTVKEDGRLGYRGGPGIAAHVTAVVCSLHSSTWGTWGLADDR